MVEFKPATEIKANKNGDVPIIPPTGGKRVAYKRVTKFIEVIQDKANLSQRDTRYAVMGVLNSPQERKQLESMSIQDHWKLDQPIKAAQSKHGMWDSASYGTIMHALTDDFETGNLEFSNNIISETGASFGELYSDKKNMFIANREAMSKDLLAYIRLIDHYGIVFDHIESRIVVDKYKVTGTLDRLSFITKPRELSRLIDPDDKVVLDTKTGSVDYGRREKGMQLRLYQEGLLYNEVSETEATRVHSEALYNTAFILHLPAGKPHQASLIAFDIHEYTPQIELANSIWEERRTSRIHITKHSPYWDLHRSIQRTKDENELIDIYQNNKELWHDDLTELAKEQKEKFNGV